MLLAIGERKSQVSLHRVDKGRGLWDLKRVGLWGQSEPAAIRRRQRRCLAAATGCSSTGPV